MITILPTAKITYVINILSESSSQLIWVTLEACWCWLNRFDYMRLECKFSGESNWQEIEYGCTATLFVLFNFHRYAIHILSSSLFLAKHLRHRVWHPFHVFYLCLQLKKYIGWYLNLYKVLAILAHCCIRLFVGMSWSRQRASKDRYKNHTDGQLIIAKLSTISVKTSKATKIIIFWFSARSLLFCASTRSVSAWGLHLSLLKVWGGCDIRMRGRVGE